MIKKNNRSKKRLKIQINQRCRRALKSDLSLIFNNLKYEKNCSLKIEANI